jgi:hypothetical protein
MDWFFPEKHRAMTDRPLGTMLKDANCSVHADSEVTFDRLESKLQNTSSQDLVDINFLWEDIMKPPSLPQIPIMSRTHA